MILTPSGAAVNWNNVNSLHPLKGRIIFRFNAPAYDARVGGHEVCENMDYSTDTNEIVKQIVTSL